ncbi:tail fiber domain-containing protein [Aureisphaera galaxeae]|uniref:tail fiber domain-containing protein n=1 Tax=Aureisphaera galaxeae TaxID=1538023 RepID=UPI0023503736|nr:tail fiber domain-containing protein [Aureisphaera galaxeae]MDC8003279.1 tail fiber domain-containing protein [Aureisphaera galaxeae]
MKLFAPKPFITLCSILSFLFFSTSLSAQVGINTTTPGNGAMLDVTSTDKGMLIPRVNIADLATIAPITGGGTESLLVYNTNTTTGPGFFYWDGSMWVGLSGSSSGDKWDLEGNAGTTPGTGAGQNFVGTTDAQDVIIASNNSAVARLSTAGQVEAARDGSSTVPSFTFTSDTDSGLYLSGTNQITLATGGTDRVSFTSDGRIRAHEAGTLENPLFAWTADTNKGFYSPGADMFGLVTNGTERFRIPNANQVYAMANGSNGAPFYSWGSDTNTGLWRSAGDRLNFTAGGREFIELLENGDNSILTMNDAGSITDLRIESDGEENMFYMNAVEDQIFVRETDHHISTYIDPFNAYADGTGAGGGTGIQYSIAGWNQGNLGGGINGVIEDTSNPYAAIEGSTEGNGIATRGLITSTTSTGYATTGETSSLTGIGVYGYSPTSFSGGTGFAVYSEGDLGYTDGVYNLSDRRSKRNIQDITTALDKIKSIEGVTYQYDDTKFNSQRSQDGRTYYGFLAQNIKEVMPEAVTEKKIFYRNPEVGKRSAREEMGSEILLDAVNYQAVIPVLVEAMKEQQKLIEDQNQKIQELEAMVDALQRD